MDVASDLREQLAGAARRMRELGLVTGTVGNVSARAGAGMLITPTRVHPEDLAPAAIVRLTLDGEGRGEPSLEWRLHAEIYRRRPDVRAIAHTHSPYAVARSFSPEPLVVETEERTYFGLERIEVAPPAEVGSLELSLRAADALGDRQAALLARHGVVATGASARDAVEMASTVEHVAQVDRLRSDLVHPAAGRESLEGGLALLAGADQLVLLGSDVDEGDPAVG